MASLFKWLFGGKRARDAARKSVGEAGPTVRQTMSGSVGEAGPTARQTDRESVGDRPAVRQEAQRPAKAIVREAPRKPDGDTGPWPIGKTVADIFEIRGVLGRGGMGIVYLAHDNATQRKVAVKLPLGKFVDDENARKRFTHEAEAWTGLIHPHIVHAFDVRDNEKTDYRPAIFMDYCDGGSLAHWIGKRNEILLPEAIDKAIQVCWAMEFAHAKGHIHRDLKPLNVLMTSDGKTLVSDFGLVKQLDFEDLGTTEDALRQQDKDLLDSLSRGAAVGTPPYMPPEQWEGKACKQSDIYAFGIMLYELFCGRWPFSAKDGASFRRQHSTASPPDPKSLNADIPAVLAELMLVCLAKNPSGRPAGFGDVAESLERAYENVAGGQRFSSRRLKPQEQDISREDSVAMAWALIRLGAGCHLRGDLDAAFRHFKKTSEVFREMQDEDGLQASLGNQALILYDRGDLDGAMALHKEEERICRELGNKAGLGISLGGQANILYRRGDLDGAMALHKEVERIWRELGNPEGLAASLANQANLLSTELNQHRQALPLAEEAFRLATNHGLATLANWSKSVLDKVRSKAK